MIHEDPDGELFERALAEWDVPEPPADLTDRILGHDAVLAALAGPPAPDPLTPNASETEETPTMLPTEHRSSSSLRPFWTATLVGFAAAAALLLAFTAGRESVPEAPLSPSVPSVEIQVTAPAPQVPAPPAPAAEATVPERIDLEETVPEAPEAPQAPKSKRDERPHRDGGSSKATSPDLKNPFAKDTGLLRIGTLAGVAPAQVYVDGKHLGPTPLASVKVEPGTHTIRFEWDDGAVQEQRVEVGAGDSRIVRGNTPQ